MMVSRRTFIQWSGAAALCACAGTMGISGCAGASGGSHVPLAPEGSYCRDGDRMIVSLTAAGPLDAVGGAVRLAIGGDDEEAKIVVVHAAQDVFRAFAGQCTHNGKDLDYLHEDGILQCRSGKAQFDLDGDVLRGPAQRVLRVYPARREGNQLVIEIA